MEFVRKSNGAEKLRTVFVVQGEGEGSQVLAEKIQQELRIEAIVPELGYHATL
jgi:hypothetical protein